MSLREYVWDRCIRPWKSCPVLTFTGLYVQFTAVKAEKIRGLQGRYFIPLLLPVGVFLTRNKMQTGGKRVGEYLFPYLGYLSLIALYQIYNVMGH